jgi:hypothetical protein
LPPVTALTGGFFCVQASFSSAMHALQMYLSFTARKSSWPAQRKHKQGSANNTILFPSSWMAIFVSSTHPSILLNSSGSTTRPTSSIDLATVLSMPFLLSNEQMQVLSN